MHTCLKSGVGLTRHRMLPTPELPVFPQFMPAIAANSESRPGGDFIKLRTVYDLSCKCLVPLGVKDNDSDPRTLPICFISSLAGTES
jgi:hypothetical protein